MNQNNPQENDEHHDQQSFKSYDSQEGQNHQSPSPSENQNLDSKYQIGNEENIEQYFTPNRQSLVSENQNNFGPRDDQDQNVSSPPSTYVFPTYQQGSLASGESIKSNQGLLDQQQNSLNSLNQMSGIDTLYQEYRQSKNLMNKNINLKNSDLITNHKKLENTFIKSGYPVKKENPQGQPNGLIQLSTQNSPVEPTPPSSIYHGNQIVSQQSSSESRITQLSAINVAHNDQNNLRKLQYTRNNKIKDIISINKFIKPHRNITFEKNEILNCQGQSDENNHFMKLFAQNGNLKERMHYILGDLSIKQFRKSEDLVQSTLIKCKQNIFKNKAGNSTNSGLPNHIRVENLPKKVTMGRQFQMLKQKLNLKRYETKKIIRNQKLLAHKKFLAQFSKQIPEYEANEISSSSANQNIVSQSIQNQVMQKVQKNIKRKIIEKLCDGSYCSPQPGLTTCDESFPATFKHNQHEKYSLQNNLNKLHSSIFPQNAKQNKNLNIGNQNGPFQESFLGSTDLWTQDSPVENAQENQGEISCFFMDDSRCDNEYLEQINKDFQEYFQGSRTHQFFSILPVEADIRWRTDGTHQQMCTSANGDNNCGCSNCWSCSFEHSQTATQRVQNKFVIHKIEPLSTHCPSSTIIANNIEQLPLVNPMHYLEKVVQETQEKEKKINLNRISTENGEGSQDDVEGDDGFIEEENDDYNKPSPYINSNNHHQAPPIAEPGSQQSLDSQIFYDIDENDLF